MGLTDADFIDLVHGKGQREKNSQMCGFKPTPVKPKFQSSNHHAMDLMAKLRSELWVHMVDVHVL